MNYRSINFFKKAELIKTINFLQSSLGYNKTPGSQLVSLNVKQLMTKARALKGRTKNLKSLTWNTVLSKSKTVI